MIRRLLKLELTGMVAVHAVRAVHTALGGVDGIEMAQVSMTGAEIEFSGPYDAALFAESVRAALEPIGIGLAGVTMLQGRALPMA